MKLLSKAVSMSCTLTLNERETEMLAWLAGDGAMQETVNFAGLKAKLRHYVKYDGGGCIESCTACYAERLEKRVALLQLFCDTRAKDYRRRPGKRAVYGSIASDLAALLGSDGKGLCSACGHSYEQHTKGVSSITYCRHCPCPEFVRNQAEEGKRK